MTAEGIRAGDVILCFPTLDHVDALLPAFTDPELREAGNLPAFDRDGLMASIRDLPTLAEQGRLLALAAVDVRSGDVVGGGTLHHLDSERKIVEIGYCVLPHARRRGIATTIAHLLSQHAFSLGNRARRCIRQRRQRRVRARGRTRRLHPGRSGALDAQARWPTRRQDALLAAAGGMTASRSSRDNTIGRANQGTRKRAHKAEMRAKQQA